MVVLATEARKRFFELLRRAENGEKVIIIYKGKGRMTITPEPHPPPDIKTLDT